MDNVLVDYIPNLKYLPVSDIDIPGFPDNNGFYHITHNKGSETDKYNEEVFHYSDVNEIIDLVKEEILQEGDPTPIGDVTDEEIQYVSKWFRTHRNPKSIQIDWVDFFVQDISRDYDRKITPDGTSCDTNEYEDEVQIVKYQYEGTDTEPSYEEKTIGHTNFGMNYILAKKKGADEWEDINNFNTTGTNNFGYSENLSNDPTKRTTNHRRIMLFTSAGTEDFSWDCSYEDDNDNSDLDGSRYNNYVLRRLIFDCTPPNPCDIHGDKCTKELHHYDGLYLAFDYQAHKKVADDQGRITTTADRDADGFYSNWIVKLSAAHDADYKTTPKEPDDYSKYRRIMCEDLGTTNDFDFNDLVFDVHYTGTEGNYTANITVQAAGGTLPIYIGDPSDGGREAHEILGGKQVNGEYSPIIPEPKDENRTAIDIKIEGFTQTTPDDIKIYVKNPDDQIATREITIPDNDQHQYDKSGNNTPQKICVPYGTKWTKESQQIEELHPLFSNWVQNKNFDGCWWDDDLNNSSGSGDSGSSGGSGNEGGNPSNPDNPEVSPDPELNVIYNGVSVNQYITIVVGEEIELLCESPNPSKIYCVINEGKSTSFEYKWNMSNRTLKITSTNTAEDVRVTFHQRANGKDSEITLTIKIKSKPTGEFLQWVDSSPLNITLGDVPAAVYFETSSNETIETAVNNNNDFVTLSTKKVLDLTDYYKYALTITANKVGSEQIIIKQGEREIRLQVTVMKKVNYEDEYGTPMTTYTINDLDKTDGMNNHPNLLIATDELPEDSNVTITFIIGGQNRWCNIFGYVLNSNNNWDETQLTGEQHMKTIEGGTYTAIQWTDDVANLSKYKYIGGTTGGSIDGIYYQTNSTSSAKKRTIRRR